MKNVHKDADIIIPLALLEPICNKYPKEARNKFEAIKKMCENISKIKELLCI